MPLYDWQFWAVTILMLASAWMVLRAVSPRRRAGGRGGSDPSCPNCTSPSSASASKRRVNITVEQQRL